MTPPAEPGALATLDGERLLTPAELAALFRVKPRTAAQWAAKGWYGSCRTPGGHLRVREQAVRQAINGSPLTGPPPSADSPPVPPVPRFRH